MQTSFRTVLGICCTVLSVTLMKATPAFSGQEPSTPANLSETLFNISPQTLNAALTAFAQQTGLQVVYLSSATANLTTLGVTGRCTPTAALDRLLAGTDLHYRFLNHRMVAVEARVPASEPSAKSTRVFPGASRSSVRLVAVSGVQRDGNTVAREQEDAGTLDAESNQLVVTGSHIRGAATPIGSSITTYTREDMVNSGHATLQDFMRTVPQNFGAYRTELAGATGNFTRGTAVDLRGLGAGATLVLVNGRRPAASGDNGNYFDISSLPAAAIERIEILADGASAIYGSDAVGGVVNIITRRTYDGAESRLRLASAGGDSDEVTFSQTVGKVWRDTSLLAGYQYYERTPLARADRDYAASADKRPFGGADYRDIYSNPGNILNALGQPVFAIPMGQDGASLEPAQLLAGQVNLAEPAEGNQLLPRNSVHSAFLSSLWAPTDRLELAVEGRYNDRSFDALTAPLIAFLTVPATNPFYVDAFGTGLPVNVAYSFSDDLGTSRSVARTQSWSGAAGGRLSMRGDWEVNTAASVARERFRYRAPNLNFPRLAQALSDPDPSTAFNPFGHGSHTSMSTLNEMQTFTINFGKTSTRSINMVADGPVFELPAGVVRLAMGLDRREEMLDSSRSDENMERTVSAAFMEMNVPLLGNDGAIAQVSLAGRYERYSDFGETLNPRFGLRIAPVRSLSLRGTLGTSFRAPLLIDLDETVTGGQPSIRIRSLQSPTGRQNVVFWTGNNAALTEETATSWTAGFDFTPEESPAGMKLSMTYYDINYKDRIIRPGPTPTSNVLFEEDIWGALIRRDFSAAELALLCSQAVAGNCANTPPVAIVDLRLRNISVWRTKGIDMQLSRSRATAIGHLQWGLNANYVLDFKQAVTSTSSVADLLDTVGNPPSLRLRANGVLRRGLLSVNAAIHHVGDYRDTRVQQARRVGSFTTVDLGISWQTPVTTGMFAGTELALRGINVLDQNPPFVDNAFGFDSHNSSPLGRLFAFDIRKSW